MKSNKITWLTLFICLFATLAFGQRKKGSPKCKVLKTEIADRYIGGCKKGLAHGKGKAKGVDEYEGSFREGLPNGRGTYKYATGEVFKGKWEAGLKHGEGRFTFQHEGQDTTTIGVWEEDVYIGPIPPPPYEIRYNRGVERHNFSRLRDGQRVMLKFQQNGTNNMGIADLMVQFSSGNRLDPNNFTHGFENIEEFPFKARVRYLTWNKLRTVQMEVIFDFIINEPGDWEITVHN